MSETPAIFGRIIRNHGVIESLREHGWWQKRVLHGPTILITLPSDTTDDQVDEIRAYMGNLATVEREQALSHD